MCLHSEVHQRNTADLRNQSDQAQTPTRRNQQLSISMDKTQNVPCVTPSSVNSVTSIALHGPLRRCVSATEAGYHNRNLIQPFYSQEETRCIPSNNRHCLNIHISLCNKSSSLCACTHTPFLKIMCVCVFIHGFVLCIFTQTLIGGSQLPLSLLTCQARDSERTAPPF